MSTFKRILVPLDGSATSDQALTTAIDLARTTGGRLRLVHVVDELAYLSESDYTGQLVEHARSTGQKVLAHGLATATAAGVQADTNLIDFPGQRLGQTIADEAETFDADLVMVGSHGRHGLGRVLMGSGAEQIMRMASVPVMVVKAQPDA